jgi:ureidoglycolate lyase
MNLRIEPITGESFAPFGQLLPPRSVDDGQLDLIQELQNDRATALPRLRLLTLEAKALPVTIVELERHVHSSQAFVPLDCASYLVVVAPRSVDELPDTGRLRAFRVPGDTGINYKANTWHHPLSPLERVARFAILNFVDGTGGDEQFVPLRTKVLIEA